MSVFRFFKVSLLGLAFFVAGCGVADHTSVDETEVYLLGRYEKTEEGYLMGWPGSGLEVMLSGREARIEITDSGKGFIDIRHGDKSETLDLVPGRHWYTVYNGKNLYDTLRITRRSESYDTGLFTLHGLDTDELAVPKQYDRKILFLGDSITAGFGVAGDTKDCANTPALHSPTQSYAMLAADGLSAEPQLIAISGRGVVHNWDSNPSPVMPGQLDYALPDRPETAWDHSKFIPDVIVTLLGTNDWSVIDPGRDRYRAGYRDMLLGLRERFPEAHIVTVSGPLLGDEKAASARDGMDWAISKLDDPDISTLDLQLADYGYKWSCNFHPGRTSMKVMANELMAHIQEVKGWDYTRIDMVPGISPPAILPEGGVKHFDRRVAEIDLLEPLESGTLLIGDSITEAWRDTPFRLELLPENTANHGIGWDTSTGVVNRLPQILENKPDRIFIKIGTNDLSLGRTPNAIAADVDKLVSQIQNANPKAEIYLQSVLPREHEKQSDISKLNSDYAILAERRGVEFLDLTTLFADKDGTLRQDLTYDGLHLTDKGYRVWADALELHLNEKME